MHLSGEMVDTVADYLAIFVLFFVPALLIYVFWMIHILPEKIAERRGHPQAAADVAQGSLAPPIGACCRCRPVSSRPSWISLRFATTGSRIASHYIWRSAADSRLQRPKHHRMPYGCRCIFV